MRLLSPSAVTADDLDAWNRLGECAIEANPFAEAAFVPTAVRALGAEHVQLLVAERDGEWIGCLPIEIRRVIGFGRKRRQGVAYAAGSYRLSISALDRFRNRSAESPVPFKVLAAPPDKRSKSK